ncbi:phosphotriesterase [Aggregatibacter actinomycetemcomitans]|nr:phosphotriesterase [Aggregatibacter actinomycetemcomitans]
MKKIKIHAWDKKPRTMLRFIKIGDIFCYQFEENIFVFGQVIGKVSVGHVIQFFDIFKTKPVISAQEINRAHFVNKPIIVDSYSLFDKSPVRIWRIIGHQADFDQTPFQNLVFKWGDPNGDKFGKTGIDGTVYAKAFSKEEVEGLDWEFCVGSISYNKILQEEISKKGIEDLF